MLSTFLISQYVGAETREILDLLKTDLITMSKREERGLKQ